MPGQTMITPDTLMKQIGAPDAPVLIDVCVDEDFALDPRLIPGAFRHPFAMIDQLAPGLTGRSAIVICQKGLKLSQGAAALLRSQGVHASALSGGMAAWAAKCLPAIPANTAPGQRTIAAERPTPAALATLWLIRRFVNPDAQVLFVSPDARPAVADRFDGTLAPEFDEALENWGLTTPALNRLSRTIIGQTPETSGLVAILDGLRALHPDDLSYLTASLATFDALHRAYSDASASIEGAAA